MAKYIYQNEGWTNFTWREKDIHGLFGEVRNLQGRIFAELNNLGFSMKEEAQLTTLTLDVVKTSEIEGEHLDFQQVRSSIARRLGIEAGGLVPTPRDVEGIVELMLDATQNYREPLTEDRLFGWHATLFPAGRSGMLKIIAGAYRTGEMQVVSGAMGKEKVHYQAPSADIVKREMNKFLKWFNTDNETDPVIKSAIAHFWFVVIHPFDDGNGRIARAISDMLLARADSSSERFYSMSGQIAAERKKYYIVLEEVQRGDVDITQWLEWFLLCLKNALLSTEHILYKILRKAAFWKKFGTTTFNDRQRAMLNKMLDGIEGKMHSSKWAKMTKSSSDTALRDIKDLMEKGVLRQEKAGGRSTNYELNDIA